MLRKFWQNQSIKTMLALLCGAGFLLPNNAYPQSNNPLSIITPGLFEVTDELIKLDKLIYRTALHEIGNPNVITDEEELTKKLQGRIYIDRSELNSLLFNSDTRPLDFAQKSQCQFLEALWLGILRNENGPANSILLMNLDDEKKSFLKATTSSKVAALYFSKKQCPNLINKIQTYTLSHIKHFVKKIKTSKLHNFGQCKELFQTFKNHSKQGYILYLAQEIIKGDLSLNLYNISYRKDPTLKKNILKSEEIKKALGEQTSQIIKDYYSHYFSSELFCKKTLSKDYFTKTLNTPKMHYWMAPYCQEVLDNYSSFLSFDQLQKCSQFLKKRPEKCYFLTSERFPALAPQTNCKELGHNAQRSKIHDAPLDCPASISNELIVNLGRILQLFSPSLKNKKNLFQAPKCLNKTVASFTRFYKKYNVNRGWGVSLCYYDTIARKEFCYPVNFVNTQDESSINTVVKKILINTRKAPKKIRCTFASSTEIAANKLLKSDCSIIYSPKKCLLNNCPFKVFINQRKVDTSFIKLKQQIHLPFFAKSYTQKNYIIPKYLNQELKAKTVTVHSAKQLNEYIKRSKSLVHGMGCAEDLIPHFFPRTTFNQCHPLPFIITGIRKKHPYIKYYTVSLSLDNNHTQRTLSWSAINLSIANLQKLIPQKQRSLYAIYR